MATWRGLETDPGLTAEVAVEPAPFIGWVLTAISAEGAW
jgi:hypothetical protein